MFGCNYATFNYYESMAQFVNILEIIVCPFLANCLLIKYHILVYDNYIVQDMAITLCNNLDLCVYALHMS